MPRIPSKAPLPETGSTIAGDSSHPAQRSGVDETPTLAMVATFHQSMLKVYVKFMILG